MKKTGLIILFFLALTTVHGQQLAVNGHDLSRAILDGRVDSVWKGLELSAGFSGKDVIIGFTDWGFDYTNPVFYDTAMLNYRVLRAWDQYRHAGPSPQGFGYGTELRGKDELLQAQSDTSNVYEYHYHGTHVASIAGGAGAGTSLRGVAYEADLLFVSIKVDEQAIIDAFLWMYNVSLEEQKRLVVNMSWGLYYVGNMDGTGRVAKVIDSLSTLGVVFVSSAGNNGDVDFHLEHSFSEANDTLKSQINFSVGSNAAYWGQSISMVGSPHTSFAFSFLAFTDPSQPVAVSPYYHTADGNASIDTFLVTTGSDTIYYNIFIEQSNHYNNRPQARLRIKSSVGNSPYKIGLCVTSDSTDFHAWNVAELTNGAGNWGAVFSSGGISGWSAGDASYGIGAPGHIECVISVAAHRAKYTIPQGSILGGEIATFSSYGSTIDNRNKPDISAPGSSVTAAVSSFTNHNPGSVSQVVQFEGRTYRFVSLSGTSMSSPFVAGVVALMLQANPALTPTEVKRIIAQTAYSDQYTQQHGSIRFGHGKIDAYSAVSKSLETTGTAAFETDKVRFHLFPNPVIDKVYISVQADSRTVITLELYDLSGRQLQKQTVYTGVNTLNMENLAAGCYVVRLCDGKNTWTRKLIK